MPVSSDSVEGEAAGVGKDVVIQNEAKTLVWRNDSKEVRDANDEADDDDEDDDDEDDKNTKMDRS